MLFGKRKRIVNRILIVEDEPLTAFDNEVMLGDLGYEVVATLDSFEDAIELLDREKIDLILSDFRLLEPAHRVGPRPGGQESWRRRSCSQRAMHCPPNRCSSRSAA